MNQRSLGPGCAYPPPTLGFAMCNMLIVGASRHLVLFLIRFSIANSKPKYIFVLYDGNKMKVARISSG